jgi:hypothetical protein
MTLEILVADCANFCAAGLGSRTALAAENLFLRKQLALFQERERRAVPTTEADRKCCEPSERGLIGLTVHAARPASAVQG